MLGFDERGRERASHRVCVRCPEVVDVFEVPPTFQRNSPTIVFALEHTKLVIVQPRNRLANDLRRPKAS